MSTIEYEFTITHIIDSFNRIETDKTVNFPSLEIQNGYAKLTNSNK